MAKDTVLCVTVRQKELPYSKFTPDEPSPTPRETRLPVRREKDPYGGEEWNETFMKLALLICFPPAAIRYHYRSCNVAVMTSCAIPVAGIATSLFLLLLSIASQDQGFLPRVALNSFMIILLVWYLRGAVCCFGKKKKKPVQMDKSTMTV